MPVISRPRSQSFASLLVAVSLGLFSAGPTAAQDAFARGWTLKPEMSNLRFQSVKKQTVIESSSFATLTGLIDETGEAQVTVLLDSVDTTIDLRNVRMRFLFFETFRFPVATITTRIDPAQLADLPQVRRKRIQMSYTLDLHGVSKSSDAQVTATLLTDDLVSITSDAPISIPFADFDLSGGLAKLEEAANVDILPSATVTFDWTFARNSSDTAAPVAEPALPASAALESSGDFDADACKGRFEILSRTGNIYFASGSARLEGESAPLLDSLADIISRCPGMLVEIGGHTDSVGGDSQNMSLSERRAASVNQYLVGKGLDRASLVSRGYGETTPIADNTTSDGRWKNRRITFQVLEN